MATTILWEWRVFILVWEWNMKSQFFQNRVGWRLNLATWLSREFKPRANLMTSLDFCPVVLQVAWLFSFPTCSARVQLLAACKPRASRVIQSRVLASLHSLEHFFTLSHALPLHDSHLNTGFLSAVLQANLSRNKANTWLIKFNLTISPFGYSVTKHPKTDSRHKHEFGNNGKTHSHLNLEVVKHLNHMNMKLLKHNNTPWSLYAKKHEMHMKQVICDQVKMELRNKPWLD